MNCQDIAYILDQEDVDSLLFTEQSDVRAHLATCRDCVRDWQIHARLVNAAIPEVPTELRARYAVQIARGADSGVRRRGRLLIIGVLVAVAAAAAMLALRINRPPNPVAASADPMPVEPLAMRTFGKAFHPQTGPISEDDSKALEGWMQRVVEWLAIRDDPDALLTAAVLLRSASGPADEQRIRSLFRRATALAPENARIVATVMLLSQVSSPADAGSYAQALRRIAPHNALGWVLEVDRASKADDSEALRSALTAMSQAKTFDLYWGASTVAMVAHIRAALVAPPDVKGAGARISMNLAVEGVLEEAGLPPFSPITKSCQSAVDEGMLLACRQIGAAMQAGDSMLANLLGLRVSGAGLSADSAEARALTRQRNRMLWISMKLQELFPAGDDAYEFDVESPQFQEQMEVFADPRGEVAGSRALLEAHGIPTEPPADWKP